ncbi:MAG: low molecular weight protein arginine phosphatase [Clostridia bacterium]
MKTILFVCTGNTCRSPMAQCLLNALCKKQGNAEMAAVSAGICVGQSATASLGARNAMARRGLSLEGHCSRQLTRELLHKAALVVGMSEGHLHAVQMAFPDEKVPMAAFHPAIPDPYGGDDAVYEQTAQALEKQVYALYESNKG